jgi:hypothetical protein
VKHQFFIRDRAFAQFAFAFQSSVDRTMLRELAGPSFVERTRTLPCSGRRCQRHNAHLAMCAILQESDAPSREFVETLRPA